MRKIMRIFGALLIAITPIIFGIKKYRVLISRKNALNEIYSCFKNTVDQIKYTNKEFATVLKLYNTKFFIINNPVSANGALLEELGLNSNDILIIEGFLKGVQSGDREYLFSQSEFYLKEINNLKENAEFELKSKGKVTLSVFSGLSLICFLVLI